MTARRWTEERIAALIDGAVEDPAEAAQLGEAIAADPEARAVAERIERSNRLLREAFPMADEALPPAIAAAIFGTPAGHAPGSAAAPAADGRARAGDTVVAFRPRPRLAFTLPRLAAAGLALGIGLGAGVWLAGRDGDQPTVLALGAVPADGALATALETLPGGTASAEGVTPMLSFLDATGRPCREFEVSGGAAHDGGIACRADDGGWRIEALAAAATGAPVSGTDYVPASGADDPDPIGAALDALGAGPALDPAAEARLIASGWRTD